MRTQLAGYQRDEPNGDRRFGLRLRRLRDRAHLSQDALGAMCGRSRSWVAEMERGGDPRLSDAMRVAEVLATFVAGPVVAELLLGEAVDQPWAAPASVPPAPAVSEADGVGSPGRPTGGLVDDLRALTGTYAALRRTMAPATLLPMVERHLRGLRELAREHRGRDLAALVAVAADLAGWLSFSLEDRWRARRHLEVAADAAREAHDTGSLAIALVLRADTYSAVPLGGQSGHPARAARLLDEAAALVGGEHAAELRVWVLLRRAEERAFLGGAGAEPAVRRDLDEAERTWRDAERRGDPVLGRWGEDTTLLAAFRGSCAQLLGRPAEAIAVLTRVLADWTAARPPGERAAALADLAAAHAQQGEVEEACARLAQAAAIVERGDMPERKQRIVGVRHRCLGRWPQHPSVRRLDDRLEAIA